MKYESIVLKCFLVLFGIVLYSTSAFGDSYHYKNMIVGDRPAGMGGTYTAISDTPEGTFYNPAGIVYGVGQSLSVSVNAYRNSVTTHKGVIGGNDYVRSSSSLIPNFFGMIMPLGKGKFGFSYAVPDIIEEDQNQTFSDFNGVVDGVPTTIDSFTYNLSNLEKTYKIGPSYALKLSDSFSIGATLYWHYKQVKTIQNQFIHAKSVSYNEWINTNVRETESGIEPKIGLMWAPFDELSLGMTVSKVQLLSRDYEYQSIVKTSRFGNTTTVTPTSYPDNEKTKYPLAISIGAAMFPSESLMFAFDVDYYEAVKSDQYWKDRKAVINTSLGVEYYSSEKYAWRGGLYSDMAHTPDVSTSNAGMNDNVDIYGVSGSFTRYTRSSAMTLGFNYSTGNGKSQPVNSTKIYDAEVQSMTIFLSGAYNY